MKKRLSQLLPCIKNPEVIRGNDCTITGLAYDSRKIREGELFFALPGLHANGRSFIQKAVEAGASAVVFEGEPGELSSGVVYVRVPDSRNAMAPLAASFYDYPSKSLEVIGVTGTDGKSTTVYLIYQLLEMAGYASGFFSTVQFKLEAEIEKNTFRQSTPEATEVQEALYRMVQSGKTYAVLEATSHGLSEKTGRLGEVDFKAGVFTNISHEHLEFHGSFENYMYDKANLFRRVSGFGVVNADDKNSGFFRRAASGDNPAKPNVCGYSLMDARETLFAEKIVEGPSAIDFSLLYGGAALPACINLPGLFNVENTMAAALCFMHLTGLKLSDVVPLLPLLKPVSGRMQVVFLGQPFTVIVDYAHTPGAFQKLFPQARDRCRGRLIAVFGSAGERDVEKRPIQGRIAASFADILILSDEDPRGENPMDILREIAAGCPEKVKDGSVLMIPDRKEAIVKALSLAQPGDTVLLLGKGHEGSIVYASGAIPWDEAAAAEEALRGLKF